MELSGTWAAIEATDELRRSYTQPDADEAGWSAIEVPSHWRSHPDLATSDGPVLHRRHFDAPVPGRGERAWLALDGLFYQGDVWLDGTYVGDTEGYFVPHAFEVTEQLRDRTEHALAVEVTCAPERDGRTKRNLTGVFQAGGPLDPDWNPGGIWRPVRIESTGPVRITRLQAVCRRADAQRAVLELTADLDTVEARTATIRTRGARLTGTGTGGDADGSTGPAVELVRQQPLAAGTNQVSWSVEVERPALWWPRALGDQPLYELVVAVDVDGATSHERRLETGLRQVSMRAWVVSVNGERLFLKGTNLLPTRMALGEATPQEVRADVEAVAAAGLDLVRLHTHVSRPELYEAADRTGVLVWQDLPLHRGYARGVRAQAVRQARAAVELLGHHPSVALWCGHNDPASLEGAPLDEPWWRAQRRRLVRQELPTWNRTVLDRSVKHALDEADGSRPVVAHSGVAPHLPQLDGTDSHLRFGWGRDELDELAPLAAALPRLVRFVGEFGAQAVPTDDGFLEPGRWPDLDWDRLARLHGLRRDLFERHVPPGGYPDLASWRQATQAHQAEVVRHHVETLRRLKYRPTGGFAQLLWADAHPAVSESVLDHRRTPKAAHAALVAACAPVIVVADRLPPRVEPGRALALDVHVVSDLRQPLGDVTVSARASWDGGEHRWRWAGEVAADACVRVSTLSLVVPDAPGPLVLELLLNAAGTEVANRYASVVEAAPGG